MGKKLTGVFELAKNPPKNPSELHKAIRLIWGFNIPYTATDSTARAPFEMMCDFYFQKSSTLLGWAPRAGGKTMALSIGETLQMATKPNYSIMHAGATRNQASVLTEYMQQWYQLPSMKGMYKRYPTATQTELRNGSRTKIVTGTFTGVSGNHPIWASFDEIETWEVADLSQTWKCPITKFDPLTGNTYQGIWSGISTNQRSFGAMNYLISNADEREIEVYRWSIFEVMKPCKTCIAQDAYPHGSDEAKESVCPLWRYCHGERAKKATGWIPLETVLKDIKTFGGIDSNEVQTQLLALRPSTTGLVYHNFVDAPKILGGNVLPFEYINSPSFRWYAVQDPAESRKSVIYCVYYDEATSESYFFDEHIMEECGSTMQHKIEFDAWLKERGWKKPEAVIVDPRKVDAVVDWRLGTEEGEGSMSSYNAITPSVTEEDGGNTILAGVRETRKLVYDGHKRRIFVNRSRCPYIMNMFREYHYPMDKVGKVTSETPATAFKDEADTMRYWARYVCTVLAPNLFSGFTILKF